MSAVHGNRYERLAVDEIIDARALLTISRDLYEAAANRDIGAAAIYDARAIAAKLCVRRRAPTETDDRRGEYQAANCHGAMLFAGLLKSFEHRSYRNGIG
jgi:hypothetical protein